MKKGFVGALTLALTGTSLALAQPSPLVRIALTGPQTAPAEQPAASPVADRNEARKPGAVGQADAPPARSLTADKEAMPGPDVPAPPVVGPQGPQAPPATLPAPALNSDIIVSQAPGDDSCLCADKPCPAPARLPRFWASGECLLWWVKDSPVPVPLVTTGDAVSLGIPGNPGASFLLGGAGLDYGQLTGFRVTAGGWLDSAGTFGVEASYFMLEQGVTNFQAASDATGTPLLVIPVTSAQTGLPSAVAVGLPGAFTGSVGVTSSSRLLGTEANGIYNVFGRDHLRLDALIGFRYLSLEERLGIQRSATVLAGGNRFFLGNNIVGPSTANFADQFDTRNQFFGGQLGGRLEYRRNRFTASLLGKVALGSNYDVVNIHGNTSLLVPGAAPVSVAGGLLAGPFNSGRFRQSTFSWVPEVGVHLGYQVTPRIRVFAGYTWMYWDEVARPGQQIDSSVNLTQFSLSPTFGPLQGPARPVVPFTRSDFWAQGVDVGIGFTF